MKKVLTIAGFDGSGGAGIQADIKTFQALGSYAMSVLTALPVQNTVGVRSCYEIPLKAIEEQLYAIFDDIVPDAIKIGMLFNTDIINLVADFLEEHAKGIPIVLDPVMVAKSGDRLLLENAVNSMKKKVIPMSTVITPNIPEALDLIKLNKEIKNERDMENVAREILNMGSQNVLLKGGHLEGEYSIDLFLSNTGIIEWLKAERIKTKNNHGTGCTLSAAIATFLSHGFSPLEACKRGKMYLHNALDANKGEVIGKGSGPVQHYYHLWDYLNTLDIMKK